MSGFVIKPRRSARYRILIPVLFLLALPVLIFADRETLLAYLDFRLPWGAGGGLSAQQLRGDNAELRERLLVMEQNNRVEKQAAAQLQEQLINLQTENFRLRKDLEFYRGIINVQGGGNSPVIQGMRIKPLPQARSYRLELILLHITNRDRVFEGSLDVILAGMQDSAEKRLPMNGISLDRNRNNSVRFRNFQRFEMNFTLPEGFEPQKIHVTLSIGDQQEAGFEKIFDWPVTEGRETADVG